MSKKKEKKAWIDGCIKHWSSIVYEGDLGVDFSDAHERCWRCGYKRRVQKCHIIAKSLGGSDNPDNLIPLCAACHDEAPDVYEKEEMFNWIKKDHGVFYNTFWEEKALSFSEIDPSRIKCYEDHIKFLARYRFLLNNKAGFHFGQLSGGMRLKTSTKAWILKKSIEFNDPIFNGHEKEIKKEENNVKRENKEIKLIWDSVNRILNK